MKTSDCLSYRIVTKNIKRVADHACGIIYNQAKIQDTLCLEDRENELTCTDNADRLFKALLGCNFQLADKTPDTAETIWTLKDNIMTAIEMTVPDLHNINLSLEHIRMTVEYVSNIAISEMNDAIDEVTEKHSNNRRRQ